MGQAADERLTMHLSLAEGRLRFGRQSRRLESRLVREYSGFAVLVLEQGWAYLQFGSEHCSTALV